MTQKDVEVIVAKRTGIRNKLLQVVIVSTCMILAHCTSGGVKLSVVGIVHVRKACLIQVESAIECHLQAFYRSYIYKGVAVNGISFRVSGIKFIIQNRVGISNERTLHTCVDTATVVHHSNTIIIHHDATVSIAHVGRIDGSHLGNKRPYITGRRTGTIVTQRVGIKTCISHIAANLQPLLSLIISFQTTSQTFQVRAFSDTLISKIT